MVEFKRAPGTGGGGEGAAEAASFDPFGSLFGGEVTLAAGVAVAPGTLLAIAVALLAILLLAGGTSRRRRRRRRGHDDGIGIGWDGGDADGGGDGGGGD